MFIIKRNQKEEKISFAKIQNRIQKQNVAGELNLELTEVLKNIYSKLFNGITSDEVENEIISTLAYKSVDDPDYDILASRILLTRIQKKIPSSKFSLNFKKLFDCGRDKSKTDSNGLVHRKFYRFVKKHAKQIDETIQVEKDFQYNSIFSLYTFMKLYMLKNLETGRIMETPQFVLMRVAINLGFQEGIEFVLQAYESMSDLKYTQASPTLFNACTACPALASCFLLSLDDSIHSIFENLKTIALISKEGGGIGVDFSRVRSAGSIVKSTNGKSLGIVPAINVFNSTALYVNQSMRRRGSFAMYLNPIHPDFMDFLELRTNTGDEERKARDLFYGIWASDVFMEFVKNPNEKYWYFFDPTSKEGRQLEGLYGHEHTEKYKELIQECDSKTTKKIETNKIWMAILNSQIETGMPYMCFRDAANLKSNLKHVSEIRSSNLCVSGSTLMLTDTGYYSMKELEGETVNAWNGMEFSQVTVRKTSENSQMKTFKFNSGLFLECTAQHEFYVQKEGNKIVKLKGEELKRGFMLEKYNIPKIVNERGEVSDSSDDINDVPFQGNKKQIEAYLMKHYKNLNGKKKKSHVENLVAFLLCQQLTGSSGNETFVYSISTEIKEGPTYCATEPKRGRLCFNGIVTGNCSEIMLPASLEENEIGTCNLASINLTKHLMYDGCGKCISINFEELQATTRQIVRNLNQVIDVMKYAHEASERSNKIHRPIGIGVQGFADVMYQLKYPFESKECKELNRRIFENIYYASYVESCALAEEYPEKIPTSFKGSPLQEGKFQFDLWEEQGHFDSKDLTIPKEFWELLRENIKEFGVLNMLTTAIMPTASTSQILGNYECIEPPMSIIFNRSTLSGNFPVINKHLVEELQDWNMWTPSVKEYIKKNGSIQNLKSIPFMVRDLYKTNWEIDQKCLVNLAADRGPFIDHSQSLNLSFSGLKTKQEITECLFLGWKRGLKTGVYYTRTKPAIKQGYEAPENLKSNNLKEKEREKILACSIENVGACDMCSS